MFFNDKRNIFFFLEKKFLFYDSKNREKAKNISFPQKKFLFYVSKKREKAKNISFPQYFFLPDPKEMEKWEMTKSHFLLSPGHTSQTEVSNDTDTNHSTTDKILA